MAEKLNNLKNLKEKTKQILALFSTQRPPNDWPDALLYHLATVVSNKDTKLGKNN